MKVGACLHFEVLYQKHFSRTFMGCNYQYEWLNISYYYLLPVPLRESSYHHMKVLQRIPEKAHPSIHICPPG